MKAETLLKLRSGGFRGGGKAWLVLQDSCTLKYPPGSNKGTKCCGDVVEVVFTVAFVD
ncbi:hypothetical protein A2U01_0065296, partial [Trifolium medium]|nr:hypothetical protein [Trifolium medium]